MPPAGSVPPPRVQLFLSIVRRNPGHSRPSRRGEAEARGDSWRRRHPRVDTYVDSLARTPAHVGVRLPRRGGLQRFSDDTDGISYGRSSTLHRDHSHETQPGDDVPRPSRPRELQPCAQRLTFGGSRQRLRGAQGEEASSSRRAAGAAAKSQGFDAPAPPPQRARGRGAAASRPARGARSRRSSAHSAVVDSRRDGKPSSVPGPASSRRAPHAAAGKPQAEDRTATGPQGMQTPKHLTIGGNQALADVDLAAGVVRSALEPEVAANSKNARHRAGDVEGAGSRVGDRDERPGVIASHPTRGGARGVDRQPKP